MKQSKQDKFNWNLGKIFHKNETSLTRYIKICSIWMYHFSSVSLPCNFRFIFLHFLKKDSFSLTSLCYIFIILWEMKLLRLLWLYTRWFIVIVIVIVMKFRLFQCQTGMCKMVNIQFQLLMLYRILHNWWLRVQCMFYLYLTNLLNICSVIHI